jgi:hypothetical protein
LVLPSSIAELVEITEYFPKRPRLQPYTVTEFLGLNIKAREMVLDPIVPEKGLVMLYAARGTGIMKEYRSVARFRTADSDSHTMPSASLALVTGEPLGG